MILGITGNAGCGKSTVARIFQEWGVHLIQADEIGHELLKKPEVKKRILDVFGQPILDNRGVIARKKLGGIVFSSPKKLKMLNSILHPLIGEQIKKEISCFGDQLMVVEGALLFEAGWYLLMDKILVVFCSPETQFERLKNILGYNPVQIQGILRAQMPQEEKKLRADFLLENEGNLKKLREKVRKIYQNCLKENSREDEN